MLKVSLTNPPAIRGTDVKRANLCTGRSTRVLQISALMACLFLNVGWGESEDRKFLKKARKITKKTKTKYYKKKGFDLTMGPEMRISNTGPNMGNYRFSSTRVRLSGPSGQQSGQDAFSPRERITISFTTIFYDWAHLQTAYIDGRQFKLTQLESDVDCYGDDGCLHFEHVLIDISVDEADAFAERELVGFELVGRRDSMVIGIPGFSFLGFMNALPERQAKGR